MSVLSPEILSGDKIMERCKEKILDSREKVWYTVAGIKGKGLTGGSYGHGGSGAVIRLLR